MKNKKSDLKTELKNILLEKLYQNQNFYDNINSFYESIVNGTELIEDLYYSFLYLMKKYKSYIIFDFIGEILEENGHLDSKRLGQIFTPYSVVSTMIKMTLDSYENNQDQTIKILDPACGSGRFFIQLYKDYYEEYMDFFSRSFDNLIKTFEDKKTLKEIFYEGKSSFNFNNKLEDLIIEDIDKSSENPIIKKNIAFFSVDISDLMYKSSVINTYLITKIFPVFFYKRFFTHTIIKGNFLTGEVFDHITFCNGNIVKSDSFINFYKEAQNNSLVNLKNTESFNDNIQKELF
jgi:hypothetical protein